MKREEDTYQIYIRSAIFGLAAVVLLTLLLFLLGMVSDRNQFLIDHSTLTAKASLGMISLLCGWFCAGKRREGRLLSSLTGACVIMLGLFILGAAFGFQGGWSSFLIDIGIVFFGAFASTLLHPSAKRKRRGKR